MIADGITKADTISPSGRVARRLAPSALDLCTITLYGPEMFDLDAGPLMIEHANGSWLVRVRDSDVVEVEHEPGAWMRPPQTAAAAMALAGNSRRKRARA